MLLKIHKFLLNVFDLDSNITKRCDYTKNYPKELSL